MKSTRSILAAMTLGACTSTKGYGITVIATSGQISVATRLQVPAP